MRMRGSTIVAGNGYSGGSSTTTINCGFSCAAGGIQKVKSIAASKESDHKKCSMKCCMTKGCIAFNYDSSSKSCTLSAHTFAQVAPVPGSRTTMACQKSSAGVVKPIVQHVNCGFSCAAGGIQKVKSFASSKETDRKKCSMKCCTTKGCAAFNYDSSSKVCALSASSFSKVTPVPGKHTSMTCQKSGAGDELVEDTLENIVADAEGGHGRRGRPRYQQGDELVEDAVDNEEDVVDIEANNDETF